MAYDKSDDLKSDDEILALAEAASRNGLHLTVNEAMNGLIQPSTLDIQVSLNDKMFTLGKGFGKFQWVGLGLYKALGFRAHLDDFAVKKEQKPLIERYDEVAYRAYLRVLNENIERFVFEAVGEYWSIVAYDVSANCAEPTFGEDFEGKQYSSCGIAWLEEKKKWEDYGSSLTQAINNYFAFTELFINYCASMFSFSRFFQFKNLNGPKSTDDSEPPFGRGD